MFERAMGAKPQQRSAPAAFSTLPAPFASDLRYTAHAADRRRDATAIRRSIRYSSIAIHPPEPQVGPEGGNLPPALADRIGARHGGSAPLKPSMRQTMEAGFGQPFGDVHVHADGEADALNRSLSARAFTLGSDIFLGRETTRTRPPGGDALMAHELTHVVQQRGTGHGGPMTVDPVDASGEREASAIAGEVAAGNATSTRVQPTTPNHAVLQRVASAPERADRPGGHAGRCGPRRAASTRWTSTTSCSARYRPVARQNRWIPSHALGLYSEPIFKRHVDFDDTVAALNHLTATQIQAVREACQEPMRTGPSTPISSVSASPATSPT